MRPLTVLALTLAAAVAWNAPSASAQAGSAAPKADAPTFEAPPQESTWRDAFTSEAAVAPFVVTDTVETECQPEHEELVAVPSPERATEDLVSDEDVTLAVVELAPEVVSVEPSDDRDAFEALVCRGDQARILRPDRDRREVRAGAEGPKRRSADNWLAP